MSKYWLPAAAIGTFIGVEAWRGRKSQRAKGGRFDVSVHKSFDRFPDGEWVVESTDSAARANRREVRPFPTKAKAQAYAKSLREWKAYQPRGSDLGGGRRASRKERDAMSAIWNSKGRTVEFLTWPYQGETRKIKSVRSMYGHNLQLTLDRPLPGSSTDLFDVSPDNVLNLRLSNGRRAKTNFKRGDHVVSIHPSAPSNYTGRVKGPSGMSSSLVRVAWDGDDASDRTVNVKYLRHAAKGRRAKSSKEILRKGSTVRLQNGLLLEDVEPLYRVRGRPQTWWGWDDTPEMNKQAFNEEDVVEVIDPWVDLLSGRWTKQNKGRPGRRAKKDRVSKCISGKVRGEGWDQRQAVAACLNMDREGRLRADGSYKRNGAARGRRVPYGLKLRSRDFDTGRDWQSGHYGPSHKVRVDGLELPIGAGTNDWLYVYKGNDGRYYVIALNSRLPYAGLEVFDERGEKVGSKFVQEWQVEDALGPRGVDLAPHNIARRLADYVGY